MFIFEHQFYFDSNTTRYMLRFSSFILFLAFTFSKAFSQETLPIYSDYLSDNVYLLHPAGAGIGNSGKLRLTNHTQWKGVENAPAFNTLSFHNRFGRKAGAGIIFFNDKNGNNSQTGVQGTYAYHLNMAKYSGDFEQLSFGFSMTLVQNRFDRGIFSNNDIDLAIGKVQASDSYFNGDFGVSYHKENFFSYLTIKNLFLTTKTAGQLDALDLRKVLVSAGYYFDRSNVFQFEPSFMYLYDPYFERSQVDINMKVYKSLQNAKLWGAISYRQSFEPMNMGSLKYFTPIVGLNYKQLMFSYTYTEQLGNLGIVPRGGFHQLTLGIDLFIREERIAACPNIAAGY